MNVFLSWSGARSKRIAETLKDWLPQVIQAVDPWMSPDIEKGTRWGPEITAKLEETKVGIVCLTRDNLNNAWILFEVGALSKTKDAHVCIFLLDLVPTDIEFPLAQFQHTQFKREDILKLIRTVNSIVGSVGERSLDEVLLEKIFNNCWPLLEEELQRIPEQQEISKPVRTLEKMVEEILELVRKSHAQDVWQEARRKILFAGHEGSGVAVEQEEETRSKAIREYEYTMRELRKASKTFDVRILELLMQQARKLLEMPVPEREAILNYKASRQMSIGVMILLENPEIRTKLRMLKEMES